MPKDSRPLRPLPPPPQLWKGHDPLPKTVMAFLLCKREQPPI